MLPGLFVTTVRQGLFVDYERVIYISNFVLRLVGSDACVDPSSIANCLREATGHDVVRRHSEIDDRNDLVINFFTSQSSTKIQPTAMPCVLSLSTLRQVR